MSNKEKAQVSATTLANIYVLSAAARPILLYLFALMYFLFTLVIVFLLAMGKETIATSSVLIVTIVATIAPIITLIVGGRTYEKIKGKDLEATVSEQKPAETSPTVEATDPMSQLLSMDLSQFLPKPADDTPDLTDLFAKKG